MMFWLKRRRNSSPGGTGPAKRAKVIEGSDTTNTTDTTSATDTTGAECVEMAESEGGMNMFKEPDVDPPVITTSMRQVSYLVRVPSVPSTENPFSRSSTGSRFLTPSPNQLEAFQAGAMIEIPIPGTTKIL